MGFFDDVGDFFEDAFEEFGGFFAGLFEDTFDGLVDYWEGYADTLVEVGTELQNYGFVLYFVPLGPMWTFAIEALQTFATLDEVRQILEGDVDIAGEGWVPILMSGATERRNPAPRDLYAKGAPLWGYPYREVDFDDRLRQLRVDFAGQGEDFGQVETRSRLRKLARGAGVPARIVGFPLGNAREFDTGTVIRFSPELEELERFLDWAGRHGLRQVFLDDPRAELDVTGYMLEDEDELVVHPRALFAFRRGEPAPRPFGDIPGRVVLTEGHPAPHLPRFPGELTRLDSLAELLRQLVEHTDAYDLGGIGLPQVGRDFLPAEGRELDRIWSSSPTVVVAGQVASVHEPVFDYLDLRAFEDYPPGSWSSWEDWRAFHEEQRRQYWQDRAEWIQRKKTEAIQRRKVQLPMIEAEDENGEPIQVVDQAALEEPDPAPMPFERIDPPGELARIEAGVPAVTAPSRRAATVAGQVDHRLPMQAGGILAAVAAVAALLLI